MRYLVRRFSTTSPLLLQEGNRYISVQVDNGLGKIEDISTRITEDPRLKDLRPVKRHVKFVRNLSSLLRKNKKKKEKEYSDTKSDPTTTLNTSEANKFKTALNRLTNTMGEDTQSIIN